MTPSQFDLGTTLVRRTTLDEVGTFDEGDSEETVATFVDRLRTSLIVDWANPLVLVRGVTADAPATVNWEAAQATERVAGRTSIVLPMGYGSRGTVDWLLAGEPDVEVVVVATRDRRGPHLLTSALAGLLPSVTSISVPAGTRISAATNIGIAHTTGDRVVLLRPEAQPAPELLRRLTEAVDAARRRRRPAARARPARADHLRGRRLPEERRPPRAALRRPPRLRRPAPRPGRDPGSGLPDGGAARGGAAGPARPRPHLPRRPRRDRPRPARGRQPASVAACWCPTSASPRARPTPNPPTSRWRWPPSARAGTRSPRTAPARCGRPPASRSPACAPSASPPTPTTPSPTPCSCSSRSSAHVQRHRRAPAAPALDHRHRRARRTPRRALGRHPLRPVAGGRPRAQRPERLGRLPRRPAPPLARPRRRGARAARARPRRAAPHRAEHAVDHQPPRPRLDGRAQVLRPRVRRQPELARPGPSRVGTARRAAAAVHRPALLPPRPRRAGHRPGRALRRQLARRLPAGRPHGAGRRRRPDGARRRLGRVPRPGRGRVVGRAQRRGRRALRLGRRRAQRPPRRHAARQLPVQPALRRRRLRCPDRDRPGLRACTRRSATSCSPSTTRATWSG